LLETWSCLPGSRDREVLIEYFGDLELDDGIVMQFDAVGIGEEYEIFFGHPVVEFIEGLDSWMLTNRAFSLFSKMLSA
jgi:hypothetical protein